MRRVGFAFHPSFLAHDTGPGHPERPQRLTAICAHLREAGLWPQLIPLDPPAAPRAVLELVHPPAYVNAIAEACRRGPTGLDSDTVASPGSWEAACRAVGAVTHAIDAVMTGTVRAAFCAVRPPGHHALADRAMGFCLFNNVAIGARYVQQRHQVGRVLIVDWDVHHGNGTQAVFEQDPSVCYFSTHQAPFYPGTGSRAQRGAGTVVNVPLPSGSGDAEVLRAMREELLPAAARFRPELILISAGFDAHQDDPLAGLRMTETGYREATRIVRALADAHCAGRLVSVLEGGYDLDALSRSVAAHLQELLNGDEP